MYMNLQTSTNFSSFPQAIDYDNTFSNSKFCVIILLHDEHTTDVARQITAARDMEDMW
jgi:hypothetical protein